MFPLRLDFVNDWSAKTAIACRQIIQWIDIGTKFYHWKGRYGQVNEHNAKTPRDHWLEDWDIRLSVPDRQTQQISVPKGMRRNRKKKTTFFLSFPRLPMWTTGFWGTFDIGVFP